MFEGVGLFHGQVVSVGLHCPEVMNWLCCDDWIPVFNFSCASVRLQR